MQRERNSDRSISGGKILWSNEGNILGFQTLGVDWYDWLQSDGQVLQKSSYLPLDAEGGLGRNMVESYVESWTGNSSFSFSYGATMVGIACVVPSVSETTGTWFSSPFNASSTQATVSVQRPSGSASATGRITLWIPRVLT